MWDDDDITLITVPGWGDSGPAHWHTYWERSYPLSRRVRQQDWLYPDKATWVHELDQLIQATPGKLVVVGHSLGCHTAVEWVLTTSLRDQHRLKGMLLVAPPALPITRETALASGEMQQDMALPGFTGFEQARLQALPIKTLMVASQDDVFCPFAQAQQMAAGWNATLIDGGHNGHMGSRAALGSWPAGQALLQQIILG